MMKTVSLLRILCLPLLSSLMAACGDDSYHYPSVKLEYLTALSGNDGGLQSVQTDAGEWYTVLEDASGMVVTPDSVVRIVANYATVASDGGDMTEGIVLYATTKALSPVPLPADNFADGLHTDAADILSIWMGLYYLNVVLELKVQDATHTFHFVEVSNEVDGTARNVSLMLYHDDGGDARSYTRRAYLSVPLQQYFTGGVDSLHLSFSLNTYAGGTKTYEFEYVE